MNKAQREQRTIKQAREIGKSGRHIGWWYVAAELAVDRSDPQAMKILDNEPIRSELDALCEAAIKRKKAS